MDISYWIQFGPDVQLEHTKKQFFGEYLLRVVYDVPSAPMINNAKPGEIKKYIDHCRQKASGGLMYNSYWAHKVNSLTDHLQLEHFGELKRKHDLKYRLENNTFAVYSNSESELKAFNHDIDSAYQKSLASICYPLDMTQQTLLEQGHILGKQDIGFKYKVTFRDGKYALGAKTQLLHYLDSLEDVVGIGKATRRTLSGGSQFVWGAYIHTNDLSILSFVELIIPGIVNKTHEITKI